MICVSLGEISYQEALENCRREELVEIRADLANFQVQELVKLFSAGANVVFTCRKSTIQEKTREELYKVALENKVKYMDLDFEEDRELLKNLEPFFDNSATDLILSIHDFKQTPPADYLMGRINEMKKAGADVVKIACMVNTDADLTNLLSLYEETGRKIILGMGEKGIITRVAALFMGAEFTFAFPEGKVKTAPGQLSKKDFHEILKIMKS